MQNVYLLFDGNVESRHIFRKSISSISVILWFDHLEWYFHGVFICVEMILVKSWLYWTESVSLKQCNILKSERVLLLTS